LAARVLITGGAGFIGVNTAAHFAASGSQVTILDNFQRHGTESNAEWLRGKHPSVRVVRADVRDGMKELAENVEQADVVFHFAAQVAVTTSVTDPKEDFAINALGTFNVLEAVRCSKSRPIVIYSSTNKVYGKMADLEIVPQGNRYAYRNNPQGADEKRPLDFYSPYGCSKGCGDQYTLDYARIYGLRTVVFRQSCIYGPRQFGLEDQGWVAWFAIRALQGKPVTIYGDGKQVRDVLHVQDLIAGYEAAIKHIDKTAGQAYNVGGGPDKTMSLLELIDMLDTRFGRKLQHGFADWRPGDQLVFVSDIRKAKADFGWSPQLSPGDGVAKLLDWLSENRNLFA
jgi:CDP-paratose 2-epimerase